MKTIRTNYFYGNEVSDYGKENGYVDYRTLAKAFDAVMSNDIISKTQEIGYWELDNGNEEYYEDSEGNVYSYDEAEERKQELSEELSDLENEEEEAETEDKFRTERIEDIKTDLAYLEEAHYDEVFQYYIISDNGAEILREWTNELVCYNEELDMYVWGVTHWGTSWDYVLTDIRIEREED